MRLSLMLITTTTTNIFETSAVVLLPGSMSIQTFVARLILWCSWAIMCVYCVQLSERIFIMVPLDLQRKWEKYNHNELHILRLRYRNIVLVFPLFQQFILLHTRKRYIHNFFSPHPPSFLFLIFDEVVCRTKRCT